MRFSRRLHRWLAIAAALPLLWLCLSGAVLNHSADLGLDRKFLKSPALLSRYVQAPASKESDFLIQVGTRKISSWGNLVFLDEALLPVEGPVIGAAALEENLLIARSESLSLFDPNGQLIDQLDETSLPATPILSLQGSPEPALTTSEGTYHFDGPMLEFTPAPGLTIPGTPRERLTEEQRAKLFQTLAAETPVSYQRFLLDLHTFAVFGRVGKWIPTLSSLILVILVVTGLCLLRKKKHGHGGHGNTGHKREDTP